MESSHTQIFSIQFICISKLRATNKKLFYNKFGEGDLTIFRILSSETQAKNSN